MSIIIFPDYRKSMKRQEPISESFRTQSYIERAQINSTFDRISPRNRRMTLNITDRFHEVKPRRFFLYEGKSMEVLTNSLRGSRHSVVAILLITSWMSPQ